MRRVPILIVCAASFVLALAACGLVIDPDTLVAGNGTPLNDAGELVESSSGGGGGDGTIIDPNCKPTNGGVEICDDGLDNDCNGKADCADPACGAFACIGPSPEGWLPIALAATSRPNCGAAFEGSTDLRVSAGASTITCACDCGGSCAGGGTLAIEKGTDNTCTSGTININAETNNACVNLGNQDTSAFAKVNRPVPGACAAKDTATKSNVSDGRTCAFKKVPTTQVGCVGGATCGAKPADGFATCVVKDGANACPAGFTKEFHAGTATDDQRTCSGCSCGAPAPCDVEVEFWTQPNCNGGSDAKVSTQTHLACSASTAKNNLKGYKSKTSGGGCSTLTPSLPSGALTLTAERTICCK